MFSWTDFTHTFYVKYSRMRLIHKEIRHLNHIMIRLMKVEIR